VITAKMSGAVLVSLTMLLGNSAVALAQHSGFRMRMPAGVSLNGGVRPPRLIGIPESNRNNGSGRFHHHFFSGYPFGFYPYSSSDYDYPEDSTAEYPSDSITGYSTEVEPPRDVYPVDQSVPATVGQLQVSIEPVGSRQIVRLSWRDRGVYASQVAFFLADASRNVLSAQTVRAPPFTAIFDPPAKAAFAGMTVVLPNGALVTRFVAFHPRAPN
jgi:hypothetical protein